MIGILNGKAGCGHNHLWLALLVLLLVESLGAQTIVNTRERGGSNLGISTIEYFLDADVSGLPTRKVQVLRYVQSSSVGTVILSGGGRGQGYYSANHNQTAQDMVRSLHANGLEVYEIKYTDSEGWAEHCEGIGGYLEAVEIYSEIVRYLSASYFVNRDVIMATGNSGGSFQIGFGLTNYHLDTLLDMVVLTGGPPISDLKNGIFGDVTLPQRWPDRQTGGLNLTDYLMGWRTQGYCLSRMAPDSIQEVLKNASLAASDSIRNFEYETMVNFVQSDDPSNAHHQARIYYDSIKTRKAWYDLENVNIHAVPSSSEGAEKIEELILNYLLTTSMSDYTKIDQLIRIYPNPCSGVVSIDAKGLNGPVVVHAFDMKGCLLKTENWNSVPNQFHLPNLQTEFILQIISEDDHYSKSFRVTTRD